MDEGSNRRAAERSVLAVAPGDATQIVFIDGSIAGAQALAAGVRAGIVAVILDPGQDGVRQIADYLASHDIHGAAAIGIVAHGADGVIQIGSTMLSAATVAQHLPQLALIGDALRPGGDILLYGCDVAQDAAGEAFLEQLSQATGGADVAASSHVIGAASAGGDWNLDVDTGTIDVAAPFTEQALDAFPDALAIVAVNQLFAAFYATLGSSQTGLVRLDVNGNSLVGSATNVQNGSQTSTLTLLHGVAVDAPRGKYFIVNSDNGSNTTANQILVGDLTTGVPTVLYNAPTPLANYALSGLAIDQPNHTLYFSLNSSVAAQRGIYSLDEITGVAAPVVVGQGIRSPDYLSIDSNDGLVFFADSLVSSSVNNLDVGNLSTGTVTALNSQLSVIQAQLAVNVTAANSAGILLGVEVDGANNVLYFTATNGANAQHNYIFKVPYTVSAGVVTLGSVTTLYSGTAAGSPGDIAIDIAGGVFYVGNFNDQSIYSGSLNGGGSLTRVYQHSTTSGVQPRGLFFLSTPTVAASGSVTFGQGGSPVVLDGGLTVANPDGQNLASATVAISGGTAANGETLAANTTGTSIVASYNSANETLTLTGNDTLANYQIVLRSVTFSSTGVTSGARTINWTVSDGIITSTTPTSSVTVLSNATAPTITSAASAGVAENTSPSSVVYTAVASDPDTVGSLSYSLSGVDAALFSIDAATGEVRFLSSPDFEAPTDFDGDNTYQIIVHANDGVHDTTKDVSVSVTDTNDVAPAITSTASASVAENTTASSVVYTAVASDPDTVGSLSFSLSGLDAAAFSIDAATGEVRFLAAPDFEAPADADADNIYQITVHADDGVHDTTKDVSLSVSPDPHLSGGAVSYFDAIGGVYVDLPTQVAKRGGSGASWLGGPASVTTPVAIDTLSGVHVAIGSGFDDLLVAGTAGAILSGLAGRDTLEGGAGNDRLNGGTGADVMTGGSDNDIYYVDDLGDQVREQSGEGTDTVYTATSWTMAADQEIEYLRAYGAGATSDIALTGNYLGNYLIAGSGDDTLVGGAGNDRLNGGTGVDVMTGGSDNDIYYVDNAADTVIEAAGGGTDTVYAATSWTIAADQEIEYLRAYGAGATSDIALTGNYLGNYLIAGSGDDTLVGGAGNDRLNGGTGVDVMTGGSDNDIYYVDNAADTVIEAAGGGTDTVYAATSWTMAADQEIEYLRAYGAGVTSDIALTGNDLGNYLIAGSGDDTLVGGAGNDRLNGGTGADVMTGGSDNDTYYVDNAADTVIEAAGGGTDTVYASVSYDLQAGQAIEYLRANAGAAGLMLTGNALGNTVVGGTGNDTLNGGAGKDKLQGGAGADTFVFNAPLGSSNADTVLDFAAALDSIQLDHLVCPGLTGGPLDASQFAVNTATGTGPQIVYNDVSGVISYDSNGALSGGVFSVATLKGAPDIAASNFTVI